MAAIFAVLIGVNAYVFFFRHGTSVHDLVRLSADKELAATVIPPVTRSKPALAQAAPGTPMARGTQPAPVPGTPTAEADTDDARIVRGAVTAGDTLSVLLRRAGVPAKTAADVCTASAKLIDSKTLRPGQAYALRFDSEDRLRSLELSTGAGAGPGAGPGALVRVERGGTATRETYRASRDDSEHSVRVVGVGGYIETTVDDAVKKAGEGTGLAAGMLDLLAWDLYAYSDVQPGDRFRALVEKEYAGERFIRYGRVLAVEWTSKTTTRRVFRGESDEGRPEGYYDEAGGPVEKSLLRAPLRAARGATGVDLRRLHPVVRTERAHLGIDYPAPVGTPVWATADGKVVSRGERGTAGLTVVLAHPGGMQTTYEHLDRFARGLEVGQAVRQRQVIGYVGGATVTTAPHLHYTLQIGPHFVDPLRITPARVHGLGPAQQKDLVAAIAPRLAALQAIDVKPPRKELARAAARPVN